MRWLCNYLRQCFCKHEFLFEEQFKTEKSDYSVREGTKVSCICKKCGYHTSYWKF